MKKVLLTLLAAGVLTACNSNKQTTDKDMVQTLELTQEWDKVFPLSEKVNHKKVKFETQYGLILAAELYEPKNVEGKHAAIAVSGPFGATKEQSSGLYAMRMAERGFVTIIPDAVHTDLYDDKGGNRDVDNIVGGHHGKIPYDKIEAFFRENMK